MSIRDHIRQAAREIAKSMEARLTDIKHRLVEAKEQVSEIEAERNAVATAQQRLSKFPIERGGTYLFPAAGSKKADCAARPIPGVRGMIFSVADYANTNSSIPHV